MTGHSHDHEIGDLSELNRRKVMQGCGAAIALAMAGGGIGSVAAEDNESKDDFESVADLLGGMPDNWGRWGDDDGLGALNVLGSEDMFEGMNAAMKRGKKGVQRFTLQLPTTGFGIDVLHGDASGTTTDTGDPMFPGRFPARRDNWADASDETLSLAVPGGMAFADDAVLSPLYLQGATHVDALGHGWYGDAIYNGRSLNKTHVKRDFNIPVPGIQDLKQDTDGDGDLPEIGQVTETYGIEGADISQAANAGIVGRGVLLDVGGYKGTEGPKGTWLPLDSASLKETSSDAAVSLEDLKATADAQGVQLQEHDILLIRTGSLERTQNSDADWNPLGEPGLTYSDDLVEWVHEMDIPYIGADNLAVEQIFQTVTEDDLDEGRKGFHGDYTLPLHGAFLRDLGVSLNEVLDLSALAHQCAEDGIYEFLFMAAPLNFEMGSGGPVNPVAVKATQENKGRGNRGRGR